MDLLSLIKSEDLVSFASNYEYKKNFMGQKLFAPAKTSDLKLKIRQIMEGADMPVMARVHSLDSEAHIGDRPNFEELNLEKMFIKEKINQTERIAMFLNNNPSNDAVVNFVYDDLNNMMSRVITRTEVANMELLGTGKITVDENNVKYTVDYKHPDSQKITLSGWASADHDIIGDLKTITLNAKKNGVTLVRAITSATILGYMLNNNGIAKIWEAKSDVLTETRLTSWLKETFGIEFVTNDEYYKTSANATQTYRFFPENVITFLPTKTLLGQGLYGVTPEELKLKINAEVSEKMNVALSMWDTQDPVATWTKASALYIPVPNNVKSWFIATVNA